MILGFVRIGWLRLGHRVIERHARRRLIDANQGFHHGVGISVQSVGQQKGVEEINGQKAQIGQSFEQTFNGGMTNLTRDAHTEWFRARVLPEEFYTNPMFSNT